MRNSPILSPTQRDTALINVIACGPSAAHWDGTGYSIGVNDCFKFGKHTDRLIVVNTNFEHEREVFIRKNRASDGFFSQLDYWKIHPKFTPIDPMKQFINKVQKGTLYHSSTSPFIAMSMAFNMGASEIVLWGVDFDAHPIMKGDSLEREVEKYLRFIECLRNQGTVVYLAQNVGAFKNYLPTKQKCSL